MDWVTHFGGGEEGGQDKFPLVWTNRLKKDEDEGVFEKWVFEYCIQLKPFKYSWIALFNLSLCAYVRALSE